jgi:hypothetical protein
VVDKSQLNKEKLCITIEHLENPNNMITEYQAPANKGASEVMRISQEAQF